MSQECCICLSEEGDVKKLPCCTSSYVHECCITTHIRQINKKCPVCQQEMKFEEFTTPVHQNMFAERCYEILFALCNMVSLIHMTSTALSLYIVYKVYEISGNIYPLILIYIVKIGLDLCIIGGGYSSTFHVIRDRLIRNSECPFHDSCIDMTNRGDRLKHGCWMTFNVLNVWSGYFISGDIIHYVLYKQDLLFTGTGIGWTYIVVLLSLLAAIVVIAILYEILKGICSVTCESGFSCRSCIDYFTKCNIYREVTRREVVFDDSLEIL
jgi:hypothetical protein